MLEIQIQFFNPNLFLAPERSVSCTQNKLLKSRTARQNSNLIWNVQIRFLKSKLLSENQMRILPVRPYPFSNPDPYHIPLVDGLDAPCSCQARSSAVHAQANDEANDDEA